MPQSFHNRILRIDLSTGHTRTESPGAAYFRRYMGGWNIVADVLLRETAAGTDPLGPGNKLVFSAGLLTGLPISGASRSAIGAKSPLTGGFGASEVGGNWGAQLKRAGYDALVVEGASPRPVYISIRDECVEVLDASAFWGEPTRETEDGIRAELGERRAALAMIGPGGENRVRFACVMNGLKDAAGRTGMGAVMGSKNLKAVAVVGLGSVPSVDADAIKALAARMATDVQAGERAWSLSKYGTGVGIDGPGGTQAGNLPIRNFRDGTFPGAKRLSADNLLADLGVGMDGCYACAVRCKKMVKADEPRQLDPRYGGPEYESIGALGSCCGVDDPVAVSKATELCNAYSLDGISCGVAIAFGMECFENGLLTREDTGGLDLSFGNGDAVVEMVGRIARREGLGDLLAEGVHRAAREIGGGAAQYAMAVKAQEYPMHEPRFKRGLAIGYAVSPTGADHNHSLHDPLMTHAGKEGFQTDDLVRQMGVLDPVVLEDLGPEKVRGFAYTTIHKVARNCLTMCSFVPWDMDERMRMLRAGSGWDVSAYEYHKVGERALTLARVYNVREGLGTADDRLAPRSYGGTTDGPLAGGGIDEAQLGEAVRMYYGMMGWDRETGVPTAERLWELDVGWAVEHLPGGREPDGR